MRNLRRLVLSCIYFNNPVCKRIPNHFNILKCNYVDHTSSVLENKSVNLTDSKIQNYFDKIFEFNESIPDEIESYKKENIKQLLTTRNEIMVSMKELGEIKCDGDPEFQKCVNDEFDSYTRKLLGVENCLFEELLPSDEASEFDEAVIEISPGVGGQEAMLFAGNLLDMYLGYVEYKGWNYTLAEMDTTELKGLRFGSILVEGEDVFKCLQFETGVHRVQRIPTTEKSGRVHTSTATVAVLPQPKEVQVKINDKDLIIETKRASGAGGQHVNTTDSAVRITHVPTNLTVECQTERSQIKNREIALKRLKAKMFEIQIMSQTAELKNIRKLQVGSSSRSDKIRTYNFNQDRITDHRLTNNFHNLNSFLEGNKNLDQLIEKLLELNNTKRINLFLESIDIKT